MNILIVDDEPLARERLRALLGELGIKEETIAEADNGRNAISIARACHPEVVLLDIRMPGTDGMQVAQALSLLHPTPSIIFTTAYGDRALEAFEYKAVDYLLKPINKEHLRHALKRAHLLKQSLAVSPVSDASRSHISVTMRGQLQLIPVNQIYYFIADQKFVTFHSTNGQFLISDTLKDLEKEFAGQFLRIHRATLVAVTKIDSLNKDKNGHSYVKLRGLNTVLEVSRRHLPTVRKTLKDMRVLSL